MIWLWCAKIVQRFIVFAVLQYVLYFLLWLFLENCSTDIVMYEALLDDQIKA